MEICLIGDFSEKLDEGYKNTSHYLANSLATNATVVRLNAKQVRMAQFWRGFARSRPQIIHTIAQPTNQSLLLTRLLQLARPHARTVVSALKADSYFAHGQVSLAQRRLIPLVRPNLVLVQNAETATLFAQLGCPVAQLPNGVDLERFQPASPERKRELRRKYDLDADRPVALHVGHLEPARNLASLEALPNAGIQVAIAGSLYMGINQELIGQLERMGFAVFKGYQPHIEELYMLADCYIFTPRPGNSLTMPLSVLEAMACNLPVITTRFGGLEQAFAAGAGLTYINDTSQILPYVLASLAAAPSCATREMVRALSWQAIAVRLQAHYERLVAA